MVSLYTSRLILQALGVDDFGIYNAVGGFVSMFSIVAGSLSSAISRFLNYSMGTGENERLAKVFSMSLIIMIVLSLVLVLLTESFGLWFLNNRMTIPDERRSAAFWVFQFSVLSTISGFTVTPYNAAIVAHEDMHIYAYIGIIEVVSKLVIALFLAFGPARIDRLVAYAGLMLFVTLSIQIFARVFARSHYPECRARWCFEKPVFKELFGFASWNFLGMVSGTLSGQGINMILNVVFGPAINAARGLAGTVNQVVLMFINNFTTALNPPVTQAYAAGNKNYLFDLISRGTKFSYFVFFIVAFPLILETRFVTSLWLETVPDHTVTFIRLLLIINMNIVMATIFAMGIRATGKIGAYQTIICSLSIFEFILAYILMHSGFEPEWIYYISIVITIGSFLTALLIARHLLHFSLHYIAQTVLFPIFLATSLAVPIPVVSFFLIPYGWIRFCIIVPLCILCCASSFYFVGCTKPERNQ
ncbi:MAG: lipopolysaccharide biosynthesis protein, partial [Bacteroidales bacterium]|nr:lipopolysaccharide biosynthesis protein [Bacteroidales bacterium]